MSKYHELVKKYKADIKRIKVLKAQYERITEQAEAVNPVLHPEPEKIYHEMCGAIDELDRDIEAEYANVPYTKPREAGIEGFWRESGLTAIFPRHHPRR